MNRERSFRGKVEAALNDCTVNSIIDVTRDCRNSLALF